MTYSISDALLRDSVSLPLRALEFLAEAEEAELRVLLFAALKGTFSTQEAVSALEGTLSEAQVKEALSFWRGTGLFETGKKKPSVQADSDKTDTVKHTPNVKIVSERPRYTTMDLARAVEENHDFKSLIDYAEHRLAKNFNGADLNLLYSFVDYLALPVEVVMLAIEQCATEEKKSLRYIEKLLIALVDDGIGSLEEAEAYFTRRSLYLSFEGQIRAMCGFGTRSLTAAEKKILLVWKDEWNVEEGELREAYDKTVNAIGKPSLSYMNKVLKTMRLTPPHLLEAEKQERAKTGKTYDTAERFQKAVARKKKTKKEQ